MDEWEQYKKKVYYKYYYCFKLIEHLLEFRHMKSKLETKYSSTFHTKTLKKWLLKFC